MAPAHPLYLATALPLSPSICSQTSPPLAVALNEPFYSSNFNYAVESANEGLELDLKFFNQLISESDFHSQQPTISFQHLLTPQYFYAHSQTFESIMFPQTSNILSQSVLPMSRSSLPRPASKLDEDFHAASREAIQGILAASSPRHPATPIARDSLKTNIEFAPFAAVASHSMASFNSSHVSSPLYHRNGISPSQIVPGLNTPQFSTRPCDSSYLLHLPTTPSHGTRLAVPASTLPINSAFMPSMENLLSHGFLARMPLSALTADMANGFSYDSPCLNDMVSFTQVSNGNVSDKNFESTQDLGAKSVDSIVPRVTAKTKDGKPLFICPWDNCGRQFSRTYNLRSHYRQHTGERPFLCKQCLLRFSRQHDLKRHLRIHVGWHQHVCPCCSRAFVRSDALKRHFLPNGDDSNFSKCMKVMQARGISLDSAIEVSAKNSSKVGYGKQLASLKPNAL